MSENEERLPYTSAKLASLSITTASADPKPPKNTRLLDDGMAMPMSSTSAKSCQLSTPAGVPDLEKSNTVSPGGEIKEKKKVFRVTRNGFQPPRLTGPSLVEFENPQEIKPLAKVEEVSGQWGPTDRWGRQGQNIYQQSAIVSAPQPLLTSDPVSASYIEARPQYRAMQGQPLTSSFAHSPLQRRSSLPVTPRSQVVESSSEEDSGRNSREGSCGKLSQDMGQADGGDDEVITCSSSLVWKSPLEKDILCSRLSQRLGQRGKLRILSADDEVWMRSETPYKRKFVTIPDPNNQSLVWTQSPQTVLIIRKHQDETVLYPFRSLVMWLVEEMQMVVFVEHGVLKEPVLKRDDDFQSIVPKLKLFKEGVDDLTDKIDFIICLGGDGTLLYVSSLFQSSVPPVIAFNMGSLGFLTPFEFYDKYKTHVSRVIAGKSSLLLRYRLKCVVVRHDLSSGEAIPHVKNIQKEHSKLKAHKLVLNEVVIDRGSSSYLSNLDLFIEGRHATCVQGDGLIISTPTGSTAYAVAAGASMVHPSVPCILVTPICPHSLSFRPIVVPAGVEIRVMISPQSRGTAMVSFDGRDRVELNRCDSLRITTASYPVPSVCESGQIEDWLDGLAVCLNWNLRRPQHAFSESATAESTDSEL